MLQVSIWVRTFHKKKKKVRDDSLLKFIICNSLPFSLVDSESFRSFCKNLNRDYDVPCRQTVTKRLEEKFNDMKKKFKAKLDAV